MQSKHPATQTGDWNVKRRWIATCTLAGLILLPVAGCPIIAPPPPPPGLPDFGAFVRQRLNDKDEDLPTDVVEEDQFNTDDETVDFADVLSDPAFAVD